MQWYGYQLEYIFWSLEKKKKKKKYSYKRGCRELNEYIYIYIYESEWLIHNL